MDFLNKSLAQVSELLRSMSPGARIVTGLLAAVVVISLVYLVREQSSRPDDYLLAAEQFSPSELQAMEGAFGKAGLDGYVVDGGRVRIPRGRRAAFMAALVDGNALPEHFGSYLRKALDQGGVLASSKEREERLKLATQEELAATIRRMRGIERAAVFYDVKRKGGLSAETSATASVIVKPIGSQPLDESQVQDIRYLVGHTFADLKPENVAISDQNGRTYPATGDGAPGIESNMYRQMKREYEADLRRMILGALSMVPGALVSVNVELDPEISRETRLAKWDKQSSLPTEINERSSEETKETAGVAGPPGTRSNVAANEPAAIGATKGGSSVKNQSDTKQTTLPGGTQSVAKQAGLTPKRVTVSVGVPKSYFDKVWRQQTGADESQKADDNAITTIERDETQKIKEYIAAILPVNEVPDPVKAVTVKSFADLPTPGIPEPNFSTTALAWLSEYWSTLGMTLLGVVSLVLLRSIVRGAPVDSAFPQTPPAPAESAPAGEPGLEQPVAKEKEPPQRTLKRHEGGPSLRAELAELIRDDPDAAASILRSWIGSAT